MRRPFFLENTPAAPSATRRTLVALSAAAPVLAAAAAIVSRRAPAVPLPSAPAAKDAVTESAGYHETEHIRRYYRSAQYF